MGSFPKQYCLENWVEYRKEDEMRRSKITYIYSTSYREFTTHLQCTSTYKLRNGPQQQITGKETKNKSDATELNIGMRARFPQITSNRVKAAHAMHTCSHSWENQCSRMAHMCLKRNDYNQRIFYMYIYENKSDGPHLFGGFFNGKSTHTKFTGVAGKYWKTHIYEPRRTHTRGTAEFDVRVGHVCSALRPNLEKQREKTK